MATTERHDLVTHMPQLLAIASRMANPAERDPDAVEVLIAPILSLPARATGEASGSAVIAGYRIGLSKLSGKLIALAVTRALQDPERRFRPSPNELLAYVAEEMAQIRRRLHRLEQLRLYPARDVPAEPAQLTPEQQEELRLKMEGLAARLGSQSTSRRTDKEDEMVAKDGPAMPPTVDDYVRLGLSCEAAERAVAEMQGKAA